MEKEEEQERRGRGREPGGHVVHKWTSSLDKDSNQSTDNMRPCFLCVQASISHDLQVLSGKTTCLLQERF